MLRNSGLSSHHCITCARILDGIINLRFLCTDQNSTMNGPPDIFRSLVLTDTLLRNWAFSQVDTDGDRHVTRDELFASHMKKAYGRIRRGRKCSKKLASCDYDGVRGLSLGEWRKCLSKPRSYLPNRKPGKVSGK